MRAFIPETGWDLIRDLRVKEPFPARCAGQRFARRSHEAPTALFCIVLSESQKLQYSLSARAMAVLGDSIPRPQAALMPTTNFHAARCRVARHLLRRWTRSLPSDWDALQRELDHWARRGRKIAFWWRDDDAQIATPALDRLLELAGGFGLSLGLAVIPTGADRSLADRLARDNNIRVLQHGWN